MALRVDIAHRLGQLDAFAYQKPDYFQNRFIQKVDPRTQLTGHEAWLKNHSKLINRSREGFITHNKTKYGLPIAIWTACEVWDFGTLSKLYQGMLPDMQKAIANKYGISKPLVFESWLRCLNYLRNLCAHHCRLWNRSLNHPAKAMYLCLKPLGSTGMFKLESFYSFA